ncbi:hypothetical protein EMIHUDRAFT_438776 [Emiliania huxleyi CCMP1516]|uniref:Uncharacterized protein n=2 Tax=Emiliania huxleyi TaxID=2903 RepID=A0A0D3I4D7_EMIH1|nr:hypothetical protein EMIHUDRAFT_438776 [Emiliania huxleyi CCMP1516]EOD06122.1 hypothetical protein EMIHUDRAFT_438776 [Emiliania huxleyi CCMP1516]|eukprot:XP_005758551.1 hypothetical protein EMIHUDRAFT_438776 [Emiliania huxleyi CCMP1516]
MPPAPTWMREVARDDARSQISHGASEISLTSRASDAGSVKDSASDAGSAATMDTSLSAGTLASAASTAFFPPTVHFFSLDDFAGHEIHAILENGEGEHGDHDPAVDFHEEASSQARSVRPGSIVSNLEQRLGEIEGVQGVEAWPEADTVLGGACAGSSSSHAGDQASPPAQARDGTPARRHHAPAPRPPPLHLSLALLCHRGWCPLAGSRSGPASVYYGREPTPPPLAAPVASASRAAAEPAAPSSPQPPRRRKAT